MTKEVKMLKKLKLVFVTSALLVGGVAGFAAAKGDGGGDRPDRAAMKEKFAAKKAEMLTKFDANKDGSLDAAEKDAMHTARAQERFSSLDTNKDGVLSLAEFKSGKRGDRHHGRKGHGKHRGMGRGQP